MSVLVYESRDNVATITINRPEKRNPLSHEVCVKLRDAWHQFNASDDRVAVQVGGESQGFVFIHCVRMYPDYRKLSA